MSFITARCPAISKDLRDAFALGCLQRQNTGALDAVLSDINRNGFETINVDQGDGYRRPVILRYLPTLDPALASTVRQDICVTGEKVEPEVLNVDVTKIISTQVVNVAGDDVARLCKEFKYTYELFNSLLAQGSVKLDQEIAAALIVPTSRYWNSIDVTRDYDVLKNDGAANGPGFSKFLDDYHESGCYSLPIVVGDKNINSFFTLGKYGCCNSTQGFDVSQVGEMGYFYRDNNASALWGANNFVGFMPGTIQLVTYNFFKGRNVVDDDALVLGTIIDPMTGLEWNLKMRLDPCGTGLPSWNINLELEYEIIKMPSNVYPVGTIGEGVNGIFRGVALQLP